MSALFSRVAQWTARQTGRASTFFGAIVLILAWAVTGPLFHYDDTWQLVVNTATTIVTFLMVFLLQNSQTRDAVAVQAKLDELIRVTEAARNQLIGLEEKAEDEIAELKNSG